MIINTIKAGIMNLYSCRDSEALSYIWGMYNAGWRIVAKKEGEKTYHQITGITLGCENNVVVWKERVDIPCGYPDCVFDKYPDSELEDKINKLSTHQNGYVYVLSNPHMPHILKIGKTKQAPQTRAKRLSQERGVIGEFKVEFQIFVDDCDLVEVVVHHKLRSKRINIEREFFDVDLKKAKQVILENKDTTIAGFKLDNDK